MTIKDDLVRLQDETAGGKRLDEANLPAAMRAKTGLHPRIAQRPDLASAEITVESTDGLFTFIVRVVKR